MGKVLKAGEVAMVVRLWQGGRFRTSGGNSTEYLCLRRFLSHFLSALIQLTVIKTPLLDSP